MRVRKSNSCVTLLYIDPRTEPLTCRDTHHLPLAFNHGLSTYIQYNLLPRLIQPLCFIHHGAICIYIYIYIYIYKHMQILHAHCLPVAFNHGLSTYIQYNRLPRLVQPLCFIISIIHFRRLKTRRQFPARIRSCDYLQANPSFSIQLKFRHLHRLPAKSRRQSHESVPAR